MASFDDQAVRMSAIAAHFSTGVKLKLVFSMFLLQPHDKILTFVKQVWSEQRKLTCTEHDSQALKSVVDTFKAMVALTAGHLLKITGILVKPKHLPCKFITVVCENIFGITMHDYLFIYFFNLERFFQTKKLKSHGIKTCFYSTFVTTYFMLVVYTVSVQLSLFVCFFKNFPL